ncbi:MAG: hypothetical protein DU430_00195 [Candidatus Tokpelaia sp.]|nr:MAG: hypothetical protein DU430_00195 [Candidatus Tokpelaia sp.]
MYAFCPPGRGSQAATRNSGRFNFARDIANRRNESNRRGAHEPCKQRSGLGGRWARQRTGARELCKIRGTPQCA